MALKNITKIIAVILLTPSIVFGATTVPFIATSTTQGWISPARVNGTEQTIVGNLFIATSTTASSTFSNGINLTNGCFSISGTCIGGASVVGTVTSIGTNNGLTGGTITTSGTIGLNTAGFSINAPLTWNGSNLVATGTPMFTAGYFLATSTVATSTLPNIWTNNISAFTSAGFDLHSNSGTPVANLGAGGGSNATFYGGVNIDGQTRLATSLTGLLKATSGTVSVATPGTDYSTFGYPFPSNATTTGLLLLASTTIGAGTQTTGLTVSGGATTTGNMYVAGNVGIGTTSPGQKLSVAGDILGNNIIGSYFTGTSTTVSTLAGALTSSGVLTGSALVASSASATSTLAGGLAIETSGFVYDYSTNNVGIGTASPLTKLHVYNGNVLIDNSYGLIFGTNGGTLTSYQKISGDSGQNNLTYATYSDHIFTTDTNSSGIGTTRLTIKGASGNVGIGTTTPYAALSVQTPAAATPGIAIKFSASQTGNAFETRNSSGVLINRLSPVGNFYFPNNTGLIMKDSGGTERDAFYADTSNNLSVGSAASAWSNIDFLLGSATARMRITSGGLVGIGSTTPVTTLSVGGSAYVTTGLGVGKVNTTANTVDVATGGSYRINATRLATGVTANYSYFFGEAGNTTIANVTGIGNNGFGSGALYSVTSGQQNVAMGVNSALNLTTGIHNIAMGRDALFTTTDGQYNVALGYYALRSNTDGDYNVAIGQQAGRANTTGYGGVFLGYYAGDANTTGANNTAIGTTALAANTTGQYNMALGYQALNGIVGDGNTAFGSIAGGVNTSGNYNIYVGYNSGINQTSGSSNIIIGYNVNAPSSTGSNQLNIGNIIFGTGVSGTGSTIAGNIGIGTTTPSARLSVTGSGTGTGRLFALADSGNAEKFTVLDNGKVGIGTSTPTSTFHVAGSLTLAYRAITALRTLDATDYTIDCTANTFTVTLPTAVGITGRVYNIKNSGTGVITVDANSTETIDGALTETLNQYDNLQVQSNGANWIII